MSVQVSYKKQFLFGFILILITLSIIETSMRIYDYYDPNCRFIESDALEEENFELKRQICNDNDRLLWNNNPRYLIPNQHSQTINVNQDGFRGKDLQNNPDYRIFVVGGSTTFGVGTTSDSTTIPYFIQEKLTQTFPTHNIEVINAGIPGAYSFTEKNLINERLLAHEPNLVVIYDGWNDLNSDYDQYENSENSEFIEQIVRKIRQSDIATLKVIMKLYFNYKHDSVDIIPFNSHKIEEKVSLWKNTWIDVCNSQKKNNFKTAIMLQPLVGTGDKVLTTEEQSYFVHFNSNQRNQYYQLYANALNELNLTCTSTSDLQNIFDSYSETIFFDSGHVGDKGNKIIADQIYEEILPIILDDISN